jgi:hypothetical protein
LPAFHRRVFQELFRRIFTNYPVSTQPHRLVDPSATDESGPDA